MKRYFTLLFVLSFCVGITQNLTDLASLSEDISESSGLIYLDGRVISHNDSGGEPILFEIDSVTGNVTRSVYISNANNIDWEDITSDDIYIYVGDFGNNLGSRTDLKIYRIAISDYLTTSNDSVMADIINFSYANQTDFAPSQFSTNFDAEALLVYNSELYVFTKNWGNSKTNVYKMPILPGTYNLSCIDSFDTNGLVTGACFNPIDKKVLLSGYGFLFFINESATGILSGQTQRVSFAVPNGNSPQIEGVAFKGQHSYFLSSEKISSLTANLYEYKDTSQTTALKTILEEAMLIYPNPAHEYFVFSLNNNILSYFNENEKLQLHFLNISGQIKHSKAILFTDKEQIVMINDLDAGKYYLQLNDLLIGEIMVNQ